MANPANPTRNNGANTPTPTNRNSLSDWLGVDPFDVFGTFTRR